VGRKRERNWQPPTPGGIKLRMLREQAGKTQLFVEAEANLGSGYVQRIESGKVRQPERQTLERLLTALAAQYSERRDVLALFGYLVTTPLPTEAEITWARHVCCSELHGVTFPAYLLDCAHRLLAWNRYIPKILKRVAEHPEHARTAHWSILQTWFDPRYQVATYVQNPDTFFMHMVRALQHEMQSFGTEPWHAELIRQLVHDVPLFKTYWEQRQTYEPYAIAARALVPVQLQLPDIGCLQFRLSAEPFTRDARFRIIYYLPADPSTMRQCAVWAMET
jgi:MmyB-like transcription regulator ligand binding domain/Helix-turn-helix domain